MGAAGGGAASGMAAGGGGAAGGAGAAAGGVGDLAAALAALGAGPGAGGGMAVFVFMFCFLCCLFLFFINVKFFSWVIYSKYEPFISLLESWTILFDQPIILNFWFILKDFDKMIKSYKSTVFTIKYKWMVWLIFTKKA